MKIWQLVDSHNFYDCYLLGGWSKDIYLALDMKWGERQACNEGVYSGGAYDQG